MRIDGTRVNDLCRQINLKNYVESVWGRCARRGGGISWYHCTKHVDNTPSLAIYEDENSWYCYSCKQGGNIISWMMEYQSMSYTQAVETVVKMCGGGDISCVMNRPDQYFRKIIAGKSREKKIDRQYGSIDEYNKYSDEFPVEWEQEGIKPEVMRVFNIRIDKMSNRIVYPVYDNNGRYITAKGRIRTDDYKVLGIPKYQNYAKIGTVDFFIGMKENREDIIKQHKVILFEGIKSVMKCYGWGIKYCLAAETAAITSEQIKILLDLPVKDVIIAFDKDRQMDQILRTVKMLRRFKNVYVIRDKNNLLQAKDAPCDQGKDVFMTLLNSAMRIS